MSLMNTSFTKFVTGVVLICYLAAASIAAAHAFPKAIGGEMKVASSVFAMDDRSDCHQNSDTKSNAASMSACKIFCAAMGNVLINSVSFIQPITPNNVYIASHNSVLDDSVPSIEPHPPKVPF